MVFFAKLRELLDDKKQLTEAIFLMSVDLNQKLAEYFIEGKTENVDSIREALADDPDGEVVKALEEMAQRILKVMLSTIQGKRSDHQEAYPSQSYALAIIEYLRERVIAALVPIAHDTQTLLDELAGVRYESFEENQQLVSELQQLLNQLGLRVRALSDLDQQPSILRCYQDGKGKDTGRFRFEHPQDGKTKRTSSSITLPHLQLVRPKEDLRLKKRDKS